MVLNAGSLSRRIQIQRPTSIPNAGGGFETEWHDHGPQIFARRRDVSDSERFSAGRWGNNLVTRFVIRATSHGRSIARSDRVLHEGAAFGIEGIKEVPGSRGFLEITAMSGSVK